MKSLYLSIITFFTGLVPEIGDELRDKPNTRNAFIVLWLGTPVALIGLGISGWIFLASAGDLNEAKKGVEAEITILKQDINDIKTDVGEIKKGVDISAELNLSEKIRNLAARRCKTDDPIARTNINNVIEEWQVKYREYTGARYTPPPCAEL